MEDVVSQFPDWFVYIIALLLVAVMSAFFKVLWGRYSKLESEVDELQRQLSLCATHNDITSLTDRIHRDYIATQKRLDDIHLLISNHFK